MIGSIMAIESVDSNRISYRQMDFKDNTINGQKENRKQAGGRNFIEVDIKRADIRELTHFAIGFLATHLDKPIELLKIADAHLSDDNNNQYHVRLWVREEKNGPAYFCYLEILADSSSLRQHQVQEKLCSPSIAGDKFDEMASAILS